MPTPTAKDGPKSSPSHAHIKMTKIWNKILDNNNGLSTTDICNKRAPDSTEHADESEKYQVIKELMTNEDQEIAHAQGDGSERA